MSNTIECHGLDIAEGLTEAQRDAVMALADDGSYADEHTTPPWPNIHMRADLGDLGEMRPNTRFRHGFRLTPLGLEVKRILEEQNNDRP